MNVQRKWYPFEFKWSLLTGIISLYIEKRTLKEKPLSLQNKEVWKWKTNYRRCSGNHTHTHEELVIHSEEAALVRKFHMLGALEQLSLRLYNSKGHVVAERLRTEWKDQFLKVWALEGACNTQYLNSFVLNHRAFKTQGCEKLPSSRDPDNRLQWSASRSFTFVLLYFQSTPTHTLVNWDAGWTAARAVACTVTKRKISKFNCIKVLFKLVFPVLENFVYVWVSRYEFVWRTWLWWVMRMNIGMSKLSVCCNKQKLWWIEVIRIEESGKVYFPEGVNAVLKGLFSAYTIFIVLMFFYCRSKYVVANKMCCRRGTLWRQHTVKSKKWLFA